MTDYGIEFLGALPQTRWPIGFNDIFAKIRDIKKVTADKYDPDSAALTLNETGQPIEWDIGKQAQHRLFQAKECRNTFADEITWRLRTEHIILARFHAEVAWLVILLGTLF